MTDQLATDNLFILNNVLTSQTTTSVISSTPGILTRLITDGVALIAAYCLSFIGCDLVYNHFSLRQSLKSAYWFFLGPFLWRWGTAIPWVFECLKALWKEEKGKIAEAFLDWVKSVNPFSLFTVLPGFSEAFFYSLGENLENASVDLSENYQYLRDRLGKYRDNFSE